MSEMKELAERMLARFDGLRRAHGRYVLTGETDARGKQKGEPKTLYDRVTVELWMEHLEGLAGLGIVPIRDDGTCLWGVIDVDVYDVDLRDIERRIVRYGLPLVVVRSKSGGAHIYVFFKKWTSADAVRRFLGSCAVTIGFPNVEIFPKQSQLASTHDVGNWLNMPYFDAYRTTRYAIIDGKAISLTEALDLFEEKSIEPGFIDNYQPPQHEALEEAPPCLQVLAERGITEGHRNDTLVNFGVYCKLRWPDDWKDHLAEVNLNFFKPPLRPEEVIQVQKSVGRKSYFYTCKKECIAPFCNRSICLDRKYGIGGNDDIGVVIDTLTKLEVDPHPIWVAEINGKRIELSVEDLYNQVGFRKKCIETLDILPTKLTGPKWERKIQELLRKAHIVEVPRDVGPIGLLCYYVEQFCTARSRARERDEIWAKKAWYDSESGFIYFRGPHFMEYLGQRGFRDYTSSRIWRVLRDQFEAVTVQMKIKGQNTRVWGLKLPNLESEVSLKVVEIPEQEF